MRRIAAIFAAAWLAAGCMSPHGAIVADIAPGKPWSDTVRLTIPNEDTLSRRSISLIVRCDERLEADTLPLELIFTSPDSLRTSERMTFRIPRRHTPTPLAHEAEIPYRTDAVLGAKGDYSLAIVPCRPVEGILSIGVNIQQTR